MSRLAKLAGIDQLEVVNGDWQDKSYRLMRQDGQTTAQVSVDIDEIRRAIRLDKKWGQGSENTVLNPDPWRYYLDNKIKTQGIVRAGRANLLRASQEEIGIRLMLTTSPMVAYTSIMILEKPTAELEFVGMIVGLHIFSELGADLINLYRRRTRPLVLGPQIVRWSLLEGVSAVTRVVEQK